MTHKLFWDAKLLKLQNILTAEIQMLPRVIQ